MSRVSSRNGVSGSALRVLFVLLTQFSKFIHALPLHTAHGPQSIKTHGFKKSDSMTSEQFYINMLVSVFLVLLGGCFAGLTLALMGQDEVYLQVMVSSGDKQERYYAAKVLQLIKRGKHWVLVTLLLSNVVTNETLPIVLDRCLGGGWPAVVTSTASIVIFGEIIPQSVSVRYGLQVGAAFAPFVLVLMYVLYPIAFPVALLLDYLLGEDHGTLYKKSGLKTLVTLHRTMGVERLNQDEVTIISAVLDLKEKPVSHIMTPMDRVYTMSADTILDEKTVEEIFNAGFSRIPIHSPGEPSNFIGMLLVRVLISYDPEDAFPVASFPLATLPETATDTSCLNILNYFQEGKSHMIVVSEHPGEPTGAIGVLTLEDVIEELIGEEIVDESDVYIDINKNIKRSNPGPLSKRNLSYYLHNLYSGNSSKRNSIDNPQLTPLKESFDHESPTPNRAGAASPKNDVTFNWKPINPASNPLDVNKSFVTIKRPNFETVKNQVAETQGTLGQYGSTRGEDTLSGKARANGKYGRKFLLPDERESDVSEIRENGDDQLISLGQGDLFEERSYRNGGIIESVINVQGVHKTIIENVSEDNGSSDDESSQSRPEQLMIDDGEEHRLLNRQSSFSLHSGKTN